MIVINSVKVNNDSVEIPLDDILSHIYMLMEAKNIDISNYFFNEDLIEDLHNLNEIVKIEIGDLKCI